MKLRIKTGYDCFDGRYYVVQKQFLFLLWVDASNWFYSYDLAKKELVYLKSINVDGVIL